MVFNPDDYFNLIPLGEVSSINTTSDIDFEDFGDEPLVLSLNLRFNVFISSFFYFIIYLFIMSFL